MKENKEKNDGNIKSTMESVTGLIKAVPVYQDTIQPSAKQIGQSIETVTKTVNIALGPIKALVWGYEKIEEFIINRVSEKLKNIPEENITTPSPQVAGPAVEALRFAGHDQNLRELYANLIATAMDKSTFHNAHPGFVEIIKNLISDEAILMQCFTTKTQYPLIDVKAILKDSQGGYNVMYSNYSHLHRIVVLQRPDLLPTYIDNLCRLGIIEIPSGLHLIAPDTYEPLENDSDLIEIKDHIEKVIQRNVGFQRKVVMLTAYGRQFVDSVVMEKK